ncbi:MAG: monofunctional biosynthetic peptidoglycan transglycosylase [Thiotrichales bacterium]|nr:MAG: monofunctional biosynthetic peptidoglycan transglycosylase [Thiotrichales bacterium]
MVVMQFILLSVLFLFVLLLIFRWVPLPTSAFIYKQNSLATDSPKIYEKASYEWIDWDRIPPHLALAVVAAEDQRFPTHWGIDTIELKKALAQNREGKSQPRGASTITQQTAKNLFLWNQRSYLRKMIEAALSVSLEIAWPKKRILEVYLNIAQFGDAIFGVKEASRILFDKEVQELSVEESAMLAAVLPKPAISDVNDPSPALLKRQQWILKQMKQLGGVNYIRKL